MVELPSYDELPNKARYWPYPPNSKEEGLGMLNLLTPSMVKQASKEIQTGERVGVNWRLDKLEYPPFQRIRGDFKIMRVGGNNDAFDDEYRINPQSSSQWDGFRHHGQPIRINNDNSLATEEEAEQLTASEKYVWYGGTTAEEIEEGKSDRIGVHHWAEEGITGRGVLLDYKKWYDERHIESYSCFSLHEIELSELKQLIEDYKIELKVGDIMFVRTGLIEEWDNYSDEWKKNYCEKGPWEHAGLEATDDMLRFIWDNHFSAVASDSIGFEVYPCRNPKSSLHYHLLAGWGIPIGEIFDLDGLSAKCQQLGRWSFFFSSAPFNAKGGVSSPPNGIAIF